jgi:hypothetical protein
MIEKYDMKAHSRLIKNFRKILKPQKWDKIVKDNAEIYVKNGKFQKDFISGTAMTLFVLIVTVPFMYLGIVAATVILALLDVALFVLTIPFPLACHYLLNKEVQFKKDVRRIFGEETEYVLWKRSVEGSIIYSKILSFMSEVNMQDIPEDTKEEALYLRMRHYIEKEYPQSVRGKGNAKRKGKEKTAGELQQVHI